MSRRKAFFILTIFFKNVNKRKNTSFLRGIFFSRGLTKLSVVDNLLITISYFLKKYKPLPSPLTLGLGGGLGGDFKIYIKYYKNPKFYLLLIYKSF